MGDIVINFHDPQHPWLRADGIFESMKSEGRVIYFLDRHLARMRRSAADLRFLPYDESALRMQIAEECEPLEMSRLRVTLFSNGEFFITQNAISPRIEWNLAISTARKFSQSRITGHKTLSYTEASVGIREARELGADDFLYLNEREELVETGLANILLEIDGQLFTPSISSGLLPGIVRALALEWFPQISERPLTVNDLSKASGLYLLSSLREFSLVDRVLNVANFQTSATVDNIRAEFTNRARLDPNS